MLSILNFANILLLPIKYSFLLIVPLKPIPVIFLKLMTSRGFKFFSLAYVEKALAIGWVDLLSNDDTISSKSLSE